MCLNIDHLCHACGNQAKYRCPRCQTRSCSVACVKRHKECSGCDGKRDKTKYLPLAAINDTHIVNDFRLLEEVTRGVEKCKRDKLKRLTRQGTELLRAPPLQRSLQRLQSRARDRGVTLRILPPHFVRRKENCSLYDSRAGVIRWKVELRFPHCSSGCHREELPAVDENTKLWRLLTHRLEEQEESRSKGNSEDEFIFYKSVSYGGLQLYLKAEGRPGPGQKIRKFYPLDMKRSLKSNLRNTCLVEHPIIYVVFKAEEMNYREEEEEKDVVGEQSKSETAKADEASVTESNNRGAVMTEAEAMATDPEAYSQYFDFYLKYYTAKYSRQGTPTSAITTPNSPLSHPAQLLLAPQFSAVGSSSAQTHHTRGPNVPPTTALQSTPLQGTSLHKAPLQVNQPSPSSPVAHRDIPPPHHSSPLLHTNNLAAAATIKAELRASGLGLLSSYGSDSNSDTE